MKNENLTAAREKSGFSKAQIAKQVGVSVRMYQDYENGISEPRVRTANKIAQMLKTTSEKLWS